MAGIFAGIVITSLICKIPDIAVYTIGFIYNVQNPHFTINFKSTSFGEKIWDIKDTLSIWNSSINIVIYTIAGKIYRDEFMKFVTGLFKKCTGESAVSPSCENPTSKSNVDKSLPSQETVLNPV